MGRKKKSRYEGKFKAGDKIGYWTVVDGILHDKPAAIDLICSCGTTRRVDVYTLNKGRSKSCGCRRSDLRGELSPRWKGMGSLNSTVLKRALKKADSVDNSLITSNDLINAYYSQSGTCAITGQSLTVGTANYVNSANVVRIDNTLPYVADNIAWVHPSISPVVSFTGIKGMAQLSSTMASQNIFEQLGMKKEK